MKAPARSMAPPWGPGQHLMCEHAKSHKEVLATVKAIPGQVDGDPSQLAASGSRIFLCKRPTRVQKTQQRRGLPLESNSSGV